MNRLFKSHQSFFKDIKWIFLIIISLVILGVVIRLYISYQTHLSVKHDLQAFMEDPVDEINNTYNPPSTLTQWDLFGKAPLSNSSYTDFALLGTVISSDPNLHFAILSDSNQKQHLYYINQILPNGGRLQEIDIEYVLIDLNGRRIKLTHTLLDANSLTAIDPRLQPYFDKLNNSNYKLPEYPSYFMQLRQEKAPETR